MTMEWFNSCAWRCFSKSINWFCCDILIRFHWLPSHCSFGPLGPVSSRPEWNGNGGRLHWRCAGWVTTCLIQALLTPFIPRTQSGLSKQAPSEQAPSEWGPKRKTLLWWPSHGQSLWHLGHPFFPEPPGRHAVWSRQWQVSQEKRLFKQQFHRISNEWTVTPPPAPGIPGKGWGLVNFDPGSFR